MLKEAIKYKYTLYLIQFHVSDMVDEWIITMCLLSDSVAQAFKDNDDGRAFSMFFFFFNEGQGVKHAKVCPFSQVEWFNLT